MTSSRWRALAVAASIVWAAPAGAQQSRPIVGFDDGFFIQSANGDNRLVFGMVAQTDGRFSLDGPTPIISTFTIRKIRPTFSGRVGKYFDFKIMPDFGNGTTMVEDAYVDIRFSPAFRIRTGKDKTPVGYELLIGDAYLPFPERSLASSLVPNRDIGILALGDIGHGAFQYSAGVFNGIPDGTSSSSELDTNSTKDLAAHVVWKPFQSASAAVAPLSAFGVHLGGSTGTQNGALPSFKTSITQTYFSYAAGVAASGRRNRVSPAVFYYYKALGAFAEYMRSTQAISRTSVQTDVTNRAWDVTGSFLVTGETASVGIVRPTNLFDPAAGHWGALQLLARYGSLTIDDAVFSSGLAAAGASRAAKAFTIAANWYPVAYIKFYATFERTVFDGNPSGPRHAEHAVLVRNQISF